MSYARFYTDSQILGWAGLFQLNVLINPENILLANYFGKLVVYFLLLMSTVEFDNGLSNED